MESKKLKMNNKKFVRIWAIVLAVLLVLDITATILMNFFSLSMEIFLGRGEMVTTVPDEASEWDTEYYTADYENGDELTEISQSAALQIAEEGEVLFKNNRVLPLEKGSSVTPFGYRYISPVYGGTGSGNVNTDSDQIVTASGALHEYFNVNEAMEDALNSGDARGMNAEGYERANEEGGFEGAGIDIIEYEPSVYDGMEESCQGTTGIVFIGRVGGEGSDVQADVEGSAIYGTGYVDGTAHQLQLSEAEKEMIRFAKANCENVVVILNTSNVMEIGELMEEDGELSADAILWIGGPGGKGFQAMGEILCGDVNPSGRAVDTWMTDLMSNPSSANFGNYEYDNLYLVAGGFPNPVGDPTEMNFLEYEENIYVGYRYYETVDDTGGTFSVFGQDGQDYDAAVQIPFGYGLSYDTDFTQSITDLTEDEDTVTLTVTVTNNGTRAGKDVVQVYYNPPYTDFDIENQIEKSTVNLIAYDKTDEIAPGQSAEVTVTFDKEDMASYCYTRENPDGTAGAYVLEGGDYAISINANAHEEYDSRTVTVPDTIWYDNDNPRQSEIEAQSQLDDEGNYTEEVMTKSDGSTEYTAATNLFQEMTDHMASTSPLTRANGPLMNTATSPTADERTAPEGVGTDNGDGTMTLSPIDLSTDETLGNVEGSKVYTEDMPETDADNGDSLASLRGADYDDPRWDDLMDQLDFSDPSLYVALAASYDQTAAIVSVGKPATVDYDGPQGIVGSITDSFEYTAYPSEPIIAATFNTDLAYNMGEAVGQEAMSAGVNSWYAPAMNIHRSPFSGRNFEYYSEDPLLSGIMGAYVVSGCSDQGLITTIKHFALNDEELYDNDRSRVSIWCNEQAMREIYLKPFEIAVKQARMTINYTSDEDGTVSTRTMRGATGIMNCMNYFGFTWGGANYALNTELLRDEWGFRGMVISDMVMNAGSNSVDSALRSGTDTWMAWGDSFTSLIEDTESATAVSVIRRAVKDMCYAIVNSRSMNNIAPGTTISYTMSPWKIGLWISNISVGVLTVVMVIYMVRRTKDAKAHPENYKAPKEKKQKKA